MKAAILKGYDKNGCDLEIRDIPVPEISEKELCLRLIMPFGLAGHGSDTGN